MIRLISVTRHYRAGSATTTALDGITLDLPAGSCTAVTGPSGCGKSTLLHLLGGLDRPDRGEVWVGNTALHTADDATLTAYRRSRVGFVFQFFNLLPTMTVRENIELPLLLRGDPAHAAAKKVSELEALFGLGSRSSSRPHELSGGEMQRAALARALAGGPELLLADEPTGNLDSANAKNVAEALLTIASLGRTTMVIVTHSSELADCMPSRLAMKDGRIAP
jgi:putative ABC transport system ATP-binding protein